MKKISLMFFAAVILLAGSCGKKDKEIITPTPPPGSVTTFEKSSALDRTISTPQTNVWIGEMIYTPGTANDGVKSITLEVNRNNVASLKRIYTTIKDKNGDLMMQTTVSDTVWPTGTISAYSYPALYNLKSARAPYTISYFVDIPSQTMSGTISTTTTIEYFATDTITGLKSTGRKQGQTVTLTNVTVSTAVNAATPGISRVAGNQRKQTLLFDVASSGQADLTNVTFDVATPSLVQKAYVMDGATTIGSVTVNGVTNTIPLTASIPAGTKTLALELELKPVPSGLSGEDVKTTVTSIQYKTPDGLVRTNATVLNGNSIYVHQGVPTVVINSVSGTIVNGVSMKAYSVTITAPPNRSIAIGQFQYPIVIADNGIDSTISLGLTRFTVDNVDVSNKLFVRQNGDTTQVVGENDPYYYVNFSGSGEIIIPAGASRTFDVWPTPNGFSHAQGDGYSIGFGLDNASTPNKFLNKGSGGYILKLANTPVATGAAQPFNFIWSDMSSSSHSAIRGLSSGDWFPGSFLVSQAQTQVYNRSSGSKSNVVNSFK